MGGEKQERLVCNRTKYCSLCSGDRRRRQTGADAQNDVFFICPVCDVADKPRDGR